MMPQAPIWPFSIGDYLQDTQQLNTEEHGAYLLILMAMWSSGKCCLPSDDATLARVAKLSRRKWSQTVTKRVAPYFVLNGSTWTHSRMQKDWAKVAERVARNRANAMQGGKAKSLNLRERTLANATSLATSLAKPKQGPETSQEGSQEGGQNPSEKLPIRGRFLNQKRKKEEERKFLGEVGKETEAIYIWLKAAFDKCWEGISWPENPDDDPLWLDCQAMAVAGATPDVASMALTKFLRRCTNPPGSLNSPEVARWIGAEVINWTRQRRWADRPGNRPDPWPVDHDFDPPDPEAVARFFVPPGLRLPTDAAPDDEKSC